MFCWRVRRKICPLIGKSIRLIIIILFLINIILVIIPQFPEATTTTTRKNGPAPLRLNRDESMKPAASETTNVLLPIVIFACNRPSALRAHIDGLLRIRKNPELNPIIVSLDCNHSDTIQVAKSFGDQIKAIIELPNLGPLDIPRNHKRFTGYYKIARHYGYSLKHIFELFSYGVIIVIEDDMDVSPDFLDYFQALYPLLLHDKSLYCISAWNDNGMDGTIYRDPTLLHRTDYFPGYAWLLTRTIWNELQPKWPQGFWLDWMRLPGQMRGRACIRPEVSRVAVFREAKEGVSRGMYYNNYLKKITKNTDPIDWKSIDVSYLVKDRYDPVFQARVKACPVTTVSDLRVKTSDMKCAQILYNTKREFVAIADKFGIMSDLRNQVQPRMVYYGVVQCRYQNTIVYITPVKERWNNSKSNIP